MGCLEGQDPCLTATMTPLLKPSSAQTSSAFTAEAVTHNVGAGRLKPLIFVAEAYIVPPQLRQLRELVRHPGSW